MSAMAAAALAQSKPIVAALDLSGNGAPSGDLVIFTNRLRTNLLNTDRYIVMDRSTMYATLREKGVPIKGCIDTVCAANIGKALGVQYVIMGTLDRIGHVYSLTLRSIEPFSGLSTKTVTLDCVDCTVEDLLTRTMSRTVRILAGLDTLQASDTAGFKGVETRVSAVDFEASGIEPADTTAQPEKEDKLITFGGDIDFVSRYVWHSIPLTVAPVLQPDIWISMYGVTASLWLNMLITDLERDENGDKINPGTIDDLELIFDYEYEFHNLAIAPSLVFYFFPVDAMTADFSLELSYPIGPLTAFTTHTIDFIGAPGAYFGDIGASFDHSLTDQISFNAQLSMGWASQSFNEAMFTPPLGYVAPEDDHGIWALNALAAGAGFSYSPVDLLTITPHVNLDIPINGAISKAIIRDYNQNEDAPLYFSFGILAAFEF